MGERVRPSQGAQAASASVCRDLRRQAVNKLIHRVGYMPKAVNLKGTGGSWPQAARLQTAKCRCSRQSATAAWLRVSHAPLAGHQVLWRRAWARRSTCATITTRTSTPALCTELLLDGERGHEPRFPPTRSGLGAERCSAMHRPMYAGAGDARTAAQSLSDHLPTAPDGACSERGNKIVAQVLATP